MPPCPRRSSLRGVDHGTTRSFLPSEIVARPSQMVINGDDDTREHWGPWLPRPPLHAPHLSFPPREHRDKHVYLGAGHVILEMASSRPSHNFLCESLLCVSGRIGT